MKSLRRKSLLYGLLLIAGILFGVINTVPALEAGDYMIKLPALETEVLTAVFFQAAMAVVYVVSTTLMYPLIKRGNESLAGGYMGFRMIGAGFLFVGTGSLLLLLWLSQSYQALGQADGTGYILAGEMVRRGRDFLNHIGMILPWSIGGLMLYGCLYRNGLIPRGLSVWGFAGSVLTLLSTLLLMLNLIKITTPLYFGLNTPTALFELYLAGYLLIKGFKQGETGGEASEALLIKV